jgi:stage V sporulation protein SpoVS
LKFLVTFSLGAIAEFNAALDAISPARGINAISGFSLARIPCFYFANPVL